MKFRDSAHEDKFFDILSRMKSNDCYHAAMAYLLALDVVLVNHVNDVFDFTEDSIKAMTALHHSWQTGTSSKTTRLAMNLWNGCTSDFDDGKNEVSRYYAVDNIFDCSYAPYYWEAIKLRFCIDDE